MFVSRRKKFEKDLLGKGFFVNYDEIVNHGTYGGQNGKAGGSISSKVAVITGLLIVKYRNQSFEQMQGNCEIYDLFLFS